MPNLDARNMLGSIEMLPKQCQDAWQAMKKIKLPKTYKAINKVAVFGMGGSIIGMDVIKNLFSAEIKIPVILVNDYQIPARIDNNTLAILSSYSGSTEETVAAAKNILRKTKKVFVITSGGYLAKFAAQHNLPAYIINPRFNPCNQPRIALGYSVVSQIALLSKLNVLKVTEKDINNLARFLSAQQKKQKKQTLNLAKKIKNHILILAASEFLLGNAHVMANQINENGKNFAAYFPIPELNHHLMEGLSNPKSNKNNLFFIFLNSSLYHSRVKKRYAITQKVLEKNSIKYFEQTENAKNKLLQSFSILQWGAFLSFYLAIANKIDPSPIPWVNYFKDALKK
ncbi:MAG: SIS domain-containing protein [Patescibacteria group bacterium]|jgi:glucose/mannose-6-phosphate isomerase